jgi:hypothetical protein
MFLFSQNNTISGYIIDKESGEKLIGATIYNKTSKKGTLSNNYGYFSLSVPSGEPNTLVISYLGYQVIVREITIKEDTKINFNLKSENILDEVILTSDKEKPIEKRTEMSVVSIPVKEIEMLPALGGESDILKAIQLMPGVQSGNEGSSGLYVRGGSPDQNLVLLDDVPLYYVNHLGGFVSTFNTDAINTVKLIKGGFPAQFGSRLSSILDIRMKDGNNKEFHGKGMVGILASKISVEGPIKKNNSSYIISFRRMLYDLITQPLSKLISGGGGVGYHFFDFNAKFNQHVSENNRIFFSAYLGDDRFNINFKEKDNGGKLKVKNNLRWGNNLFAFRWNHIYSSNLFSNVTIAYTRYRFLTEFSSKNTQNSENSKALQQFKSGIFDFSAKIDFEYFISNNYKLKFGTSSIYHKFKPGINKINRREDNNSIIDTIFGSKNIFALENAVYIENMLKIGNKLSANLGFRIVNYQVNHQNFYSYEPRILFNYLISKQTSIKLSYAQMQQNVHLLTSSGVGFPRDLWVPATEKSIPEQSQQIALGMAKTLENGKYEMSIESYYKKMKNLIAYKDGTNFIGNSTNWEDKVETNGKGNSYGLEFLIQKKEGKSTGWVSYTYSKSTRQFENINNGNSYPYKFDRRHDISIVFNHKLKKNIDFSATWILGSGYPVTLAAGKYIVSDNVGNFHINDVNFNDFASQVDIINGRNNFRMRAFHRLDIGFNFRKQKKHGVRTWNISIFNLYNRQNPYYYFFDSKDYLSNSNELVLKQQSLFPIMPSFSYSYKF